MRRMRFKGIIASIAAGAMLTSPTSALASGNAPQQINPWAALTALSGGPSAAALCGASASASAMQPTTGCVLPVIDTPAPVANVATTAPPPPVAAGSATTTLLLGLVAIASAVGFWFAVNGHGHNNNQTPVSPG